VVLSRKHFAFLLLVFYVFSCPQDSDGMESTSLLRSIDLALMQSNQALDLQDNLLLSKMDIATAEHQFDTKLVPLTSIGFTQGTGSQRLGLEFRKETELGTTISYGAVGNRIDDNAGVYVVENSTSARAFVKISQGLFRRWGQKYNLTDLDKAELRDKEEEILAERSRQTLILDTVRKYYDLVLAGQLLEKSEQALDRSREHLSSATSRQAVGLVSKVDVYRAELAMLDAESGKENQIRLQQRAVDSYRDLLGLYEDENISVPKNISKMAPVIPEAWEENLFRTRLDWQAHRVSAQVNKLEIAKAKQNLAPDVGLSFTLEQKGEGDSPEEALVMDQTNWSIQLEMLSSLDSFNEESALLRKKIDMTKLRRTEESLRRKIIRDSKEAFRNLQAEERNHHISLKRMHQAEMALDLAKTRYEKGLSNNLDVLDAENAFSEAGIIISRSLTAYNLAAVSLAYNLGVLDRRWIEISLSPSEDNPAARNN
jgi:outer membrane protein